MFWGLTNRTENRYNICGKAGEGGGLWTKKAETRGGAPVGGVCFGVWVFRLKGGGGTTWGGVKKGRDENRELGAAKGGGESLLRWGPLKTRDDSKQGGWGGDPSGWGKE